MSQPLPPCSILLLAGGRGQRMGGRDKGLVEWQGRPLIEHVLEKVRPLTDDLIISCNRNLDRYRLYADQIASDRQGDYPGPLAGVLTGLAVARHEWIVVLACDAPRVDRVLIDDLRRAAHGSGEAAMIRQAGYWQPMFSVLPLGTLPALESAWSAGERSLQRVLTAIGVQAVECAEDDMRLANFNTPQWLQT
ncbi:Molybdenum cofactor guanylyltransferase [Pseudomonas fluorescens]|uniref:molybdenum cofactor guanylyltransferase MobA n=1 Tax=Pseudomonas fluorescens TaxID=294 RepID=UPI00125763EC|nr:molybdenum cofactor guanylyltransferase MobA [Pseudomonas fluorescens]CAG8863591.1 Molybdenum cofactor guanylyltransferase [Pseudomonas fluorescens]